MKIVDPSPQKNDYLSAIYFVALAEQGIEQITDLDGVHHETVLINGEHLTPEAILSLKERHNRIISFDINDHSSLTYTYANAPESTLISMIFKLAGVQRENRCRDNLLGTDFVSRIHNREFLSPEAWCLYCSHIIHPLPYIPWQRGAAVSGKPFEERSGNVMISGSNQFERFILFLNLMRAGRLDPRSKFITHHYFNRQMAAQFRYCEDCITERERIGHSPYVAGRGRPDNCASPAYWPANLDWSEPGRWHNRCPRSFFWLAEQFHAARGGVDFSFLESALNGNIQSWEDYFSDLGHASYAADLKWTASIYCPPRFWENVQAGCVNLLPARTLDQAYFPEMEEGVDYLTFDETMVEFPSHTPKELDEVRARSTELYENWIRQPQRIARHIIDTIQQ